VRLPYRLLKILEGESLLNDASALLIYRVAVGAAFAASLSFSSAAPTIALALIGSPLIGYVLARLTLKLTSPIDDIPTMIIVQFANCFLVWIVAEKLGLSPIITIVVFAIAVARSSPVRTPARKRVPAYAVWETVVFLLNVVAFVAIGMQLRPIWAGLDVAVRWHYCAIAAAVLLAVILTRFAWVMIYDAGMRVRLGRKGVRKSDFSVKESVLVSWCGMRGIVTLAAAFALPENFPYRDLILLTAFGVVVGTLVIQGLTLRPLILALALDDDDPLAREVQQARGAAYRAALKEIDGDASREAKILRLEYEEMLTVERGDRLASGELPADPLRRRAIRAARVSLFTMRRTGEIGDDAYHRLEEELDWAELNAGGR
jgi:CPA1 family monovalent cation:H+ antiporter